jgi:ketosteroid isomerase-like protein
MSEENVELVRAVYARWSHGDFRATLDVVDPLVLFVQRPPLPESGTYLGIERLIEYTRGFLESWSHITIEAEEIAHADGSVVATVRQRGVGSGSGAETDLRYFQVWSFRGRKVIRLENFQERAEALEAAAGVALASALREEEMRQLKLLPAPASRPQH